MQLLRLIKLRGLDRSHSDSLESMRCNRTLTWQFPAVRTGDPPVRPRRPADSEVGSEIRERSEDQQQNGKMPFTQATSVTLGAADHVMAPGE